MLNLRHCEERSDEAIQQVVVLDCFTSFNASMLTMMGAGEKCLKLKTSPLDTATAM